MLDTTSGRIAYASTLRWYPAIENNLIIATSCAVVLAASPKTTHAFTATNAGGGIYLQQRSSGVLVNELTESNTTKDGHSTHVRLGNV